MASTANIHEQDARSRKEAILSLVEMLLQESGHTARGASHLFLVTDVY
jgi:hypothetical protein